MPAFRAGKTFIYFADFKHHVGVYPPVQDARLRKKLVRFANEKGNLSFQLNEAMPNDLIAEIAQALARQYGATTST